MTGKFGIGTLLVLGGYLLSLMSCKSDVDTDLPYILLDGANPYYIDSIGGQYVEPGYKGLDDIDGDLTSDIKVTYPTITTDSAKSYQVFYTLTDKSGNTFTTYRSVVVRNAAWFLEGFYPNSLAFCDGDSITKFAASVLASPVLNDEFYLRNFGNFGQTKDITGSVDRSTRKITFSTPQLLADSSTLDAVIADSTYVSRTDTVTFQVYFSRTLNGQPENCITVYKK